jgi:hypothetical protein
MTWMRFWFALERRVNKRRSALYSGDDGEEKTFNGAKKELL